MTEAPPARTTSKPPRWLILSHAFNVDGRAESVTITDKIPHLIAAGIEPVVLSSVMGARDERFTHYQLLPWGPAGMRFDLRHLLARRWGTRLSLPRGHVADQHRACAVHCAGTTAVRVAQPVVVGPPGGGARGETGAARRG